MANQPTNPSDADRPDVPEDVQALILRYHDDDLDAAGVSRLREALTQSESARALFVRWAMHSQLLSESLSANYHEEGEDPWQGSPTILAELAQLEEHAQATLVEIHHFDKPWYASRWAAGLGSLAAILALAITLILTLTGSDPPPTQPDFTTNTVEPNKPAESAPPILRDPTPVATLTNTHNATWARPASAGPEHPPTTGSHLHPGTRLTLTQGFAEITTVSGAVAIIEAPATIELLNNDNAIHLHTGKLVGICETESSKGFLVRTPHMDVIDLGTVFGVEIAQGVSRTTVFEGEVAVTAARPEGSEAETVYLTQGQSAQVDHLARVERFTPAPQAGFVRQWLSIAQPPQVTGQIEYQPALPASLATGATESNQIQLYPEARGVQLDRDFRATLTEPGRHETFAAEDAQPIGETRVDAYLVHYDFKVGEGDPQSPRQATIRFDRPILGVIADEKLLFASDRLFAPVGMDFGPSVNPGDPDLPTGRGLEPKLSLPGDIVEISEDRRTLTIELYGAMAVDQLRVLVQSPEPTVQ